MDIDQPFIFTPQNPGEFDAWAKWQRSRYGAEKVPILPAQEDLSACKFCHHELFTAEDMQDPEGVGPPHPEWQYLYACGTIHSNKGWQQSAGCRELIKIRSRG